MIVRERIDLCVDSFDARDEQTIRIHLKYYTIHVNGLNNLQMPHWLSTRIYTADTLVDISSFDKRGSD